MYPLLLVAPSLLQLARRSAYFISESKSHSFTNPAPPMKLETAHPLVDGDRVDAATVAVPYIPRQSHDRHLLQSYAEHELGSFGTAVHMVATVYLYVAIKVKPFESLVLGSHQQRLMSLIPSCPPQVLFLDDAQCHCAPDSRSSLRPSPRRQQGRRCRSACSWTASFSHVPGSHLGWFRPRPCCCRLEPNYHSSYSFNTLVSMYCAVRSLYLKSFN